MSTYYEVEWNVWTSASGTMNHKRKFLTQPPADKLHAELLASMNVSANSANEQNGGPGYIEVLQPVWRVTRERV